MSISEVWRLTLLVTALNLPSSRSMASSVSCMCRCMSSSGSDIAKGCGKTQLSHTMSVVAQVP